MSGFISQERLIEIHLKHSSVGLQEARRIAKNEILKQYGDMDNYRKAKIEAVKEARKDNNYKKMIAKFQRAYDKVSNEIGDKQSRKQYRLFLSNNVRKYKNVAYAELEAKKELEEWQQQHGISTEKKDVDTILSQIAIDYPELDITETEQYVDIVDMLEDGCSIEEALKEAQTRHELISDLEDNNIKNMSDRERAFYTELDADDVKFAERMKAIQKDMSWTYEKVYRMNHADDEAQSIIDNTKGSTNKEVEYIEGTREALEDNIDNDSEEDNIEEEQDPDSIDGSED